MWLAVTWLACSGWLRRELDDWCLHDEPLSGPFTTDVATGADSS